MSELQHDTPVVLVVEDEKDLAQVYTTQLSESYQVRTAHTGDEAVALLDEHVDVVMLDRRLSGSSGREVLEHIARQELDCRVAMVTGVDPDFSLLDMEVDDYLVKPVSKAELERTVDLLANLNSFSEPIQEFRALASKTAVIEEEMSRSELAASDTYREKVLRDVDAHELPPVLADLMDEYQALDIARPEFMWKWVHKLAPANTLPFVDTPFRDEVPIDKTLLILYVTLLDDALEKNADRATFWELSKLPRHRATVETGDDDVDHAIVTFGQRVWELLQDRIQRGPNYEVYRDLLNYDVRQAINAIEYSDLVIRQPNIATMEDLNRYESHNMVMFAYADIDLMHTPDRYDTELSTIREAVWHAQQMARIGNWVSTWERELREGDVSSGVVVYALDHGIIEHAELHDLASDGGRSVEEMIDRIRENDLEAYFFKRWSDHYDQLESINQQLEGLDLRPFIEGTEEVLRFHLASRGLK